MNISILKNPARWLCTGVALVLATAGFSAQAVAQSGCGGSIGISTDPNTILDPIQFTGYPQGEPVAITVNPAAGNLSLPLTVGGVRYALTCADNGDRVPCSFGNDTGAASGEIPITFAGLATDPGTCGVTLVTENPVDLGPGTVRFEFPPQALDQEGCTINFNVIVNDRGTDGTPLRLTPAAEANGSCEIDGGSPIAGEAAGSAIIQLVTVPDIELLKEISLNGVDWFDANDAASAPIAEFPSGAMYRLTVTNTGTADLTNVVINDPELGIVDAAIADLAAGTSVVLDSGMIPALSVAERCNSGGLFNNLANVAGTSVDDGTVVTDDDPANLVCVGIDVDKQGPDLAKVGDPEDFTFTLSNLSGMVLEDCSAFDDPTFGQIFGPGATLPMGDTVINESRTALATDANPLVNEVTLTCNVTGGVNSVTLTATDDHSVDLVAPDVDVTKVCRPDPVEIGGTIDWVITVANTGNADLNCLVNDPEAGFTDEAVFLAAGDSTTLNASRPVVADDVPGITNTAEAVCSLADFDLPNTVRDEDTATCAVPPPVEEICRTPGFWGTHAGTEKRRSSNLTQTVIDAGGPLQICGQTIDNTEVGNMSSAVEAMCVSIEGFQQRQLARQLTAMALNCIVSGGGADCAGTSVSDLFTGANAACEADAEDLSGYIARVDCFNNGGQFDETSGECLVDDFDPNNCHNRELDEATDIFDGISPLPGPAGSSRACSSANGNGVKVVPADDGSSSFIKLLPARAVPATK
ncbi:MAG: hypothetical protein RQ741_00945 [Wenzhouxiangellaceae bacterium]|nr:hypothetical protein [Wenzhouxiangellaceae bacterium]